MCEGLKRPQSVRTIEIMNGTNALIIGDTREQIADNHLFTKVSPKMEWATKYSTEIISPIYKYHNHRQHVSQSALPLCPIFSPNHETRTNPQPTNLPTLRFPQGDLYTTPPPSSTSPSQPTHRQWPVGAPPSLSPSLPTWPHEGVPSKILPPSHPPSPAGTATCTPSLSLPLSTKAA